MKMSLHLMSVGVGALITFGSTGVGYSQTLPDGQPQKQSPRQAFSDNSTKSPAIASSDPSRIAEIAQTFRPKNQINPSPKQPPSDNPTKSPAIAEIAQTFRPEKLTASLSPAQNSVVVKLPQIKAIAQTFSPPQPQAVSRPNLDTVAQTFTPPVQKPLQKRSVSEEIKPANRNATKTTAPTRGSRAIAQLPPVVETPKLEDVARAFEPEKLSDTRTAQTPKPASTKPATPATQPSAQNAPTKPSTPLPPSGPPSTAPTPAPIENPKPSAPTPGRSEPAPAYLNPLPNPLQFPTRPEEVRLQGTQPITLAQAIELAERNNRDLEIARLTLERSRAVVREAQAANAPTLALQSDLTRSLSASANRGQSGLAALLGGGGDASPNTSLTASAQLSYNIFTSGLRPAQIRAAERQARFSELEVERTREQLRLDTSTDYYNLQNADEQVRINQAAVRNAESSLRDTQAQERAGLGTRFDVLQSQVNLADSQQQLTNAIATQSVNRRQLAQRLSLAESLNVSAADPVAPAGTWALPLEDSIVLAYKNRAELEQQLVQREVSEAQRRANLATLGPTISASANYNVLDPFEQSGGFSDGYSFALQARWNLYDGGAAVARASQSERDKQIAEARFAQNRNIARFQVEQAFSTLQSNRINITTANTALSQAREALQLARLRFQAGVGTQTDVINQETALTRAEGRLVSAIIGYNLALAQLQRAVSNIAR